VNAGKTAEGNATLSLMLGGEVVQTATSTPNSYVNIIINGQTYRLLLEAVP